MADVRVARGLLYEEIGRIDEARVDFEAALTYVPDYAPALEALDRIGG
jgi:lipoprotein NlpI